MACPLVTAVGTGVGKCYQAEYSTKGDLLIKLTYNLLQNYSEKWVTLLACELCLNKAIFQLNRTSLMGQW